MATLLSVVLPVCFFVLSNAIDVSIAGVGTFDVPVNPLQNYCVRYLKKFASEFRYPSDDCGHELSRKQWNNYKQGFQKSLLDFGSSYAECNRNANNDPTHKLYCNYIDEAVTQCECDKTNCITEDVLEEIKDEEKSFCYPVASYLCKEVQKTLNPQCERAMSKLVSVEKYETRYVSLQCHPDRCPSSALKLTATVALLTLLISFVL